MSKSRKLKMLMLSSELITLEETEFEEIDTVCTKEFNVDFYDELLFTSKDKEAIDNNENYQTFMPFKMEKASLKSLHRQLALKCHPDLNADADDEEFKEIQAAYERGDGSSLLTAALRHNIEVDIESINSNEIEQQIAHRKSQIVLKKTSVAWKWHHSEKSEVLRAEIRSIMKINLEEFNAWILKKKAPS
jgi:hypothetical protein